ncbi:hypothetical protein LCGC14_0527130 [marine sediment metagenome]|uniref:Uncharacterized protein n=1 Tax=marine sediment metagenome TaxID=412755 RepID=A0A0F9S1F6_9ZZZZ
MVTNLKEYDLRSYDGGTIYLPEYIGGEEGWGNLASPSVHIARAAQRYPRGTMFRKGDRSWVYTKLYTTTRVDAYGGYTGGLGLFSVAQDSSGLTISTATVGESTITVTDTLTVNAYAGGLLTMFEANLPIVSMRIISNTATVITLDGVLPGTYTSSATIHVIASPYHDVVAPGVSVSAGSAFDYCPGILNSPIDESGNVAAVNDFVWLQCWGQCFTWASGTYEGDTGGERTVVMMGDGASQVITDALIETHACYQHIGHLFPGTGDVTVGNNPDPSDGTASSFMQHVVYLTIRQ